MKKFLSILLLLCLLSGALFADNNREWRAIWSVTWDQYASNLNVEQLKMRTRAILDKHVEAGMNAVLWHVRQGGTVYYPSTIEPWGSYLGYTDPGYDPLEYAINEAHKRGLELHGWFNTFHCIPVSMPAHLLPSTPNGSAVTVTDHLCLNPNLYPQD